MTFPVLTTARLTLRVPRIEDFERYAEVIGDPVAARHIGGHLPRAGAWRRFLQMPGAWLVQGFAMFSVIDTATGRWLGQSGPWRPEGWPGNEIGFVFHPDAWGRGYAREATAAAMDWAFDHLGWDAVIHCIEPGNVASQRLAQRLGSINTGPGRLPPPSDGVAVDIWRQSAAQWRARRGGDAA
ncbi:GNAT family N-acetyltransferase [Luteimonas deserti]|uniref:GNAT family N-acetyltransferase n=1 Tax=Luteimonas deserti TaxID=2752306 RepID=A0A7Z0QUN9_9GAMM|nr:GNAT family N-acetyltransferase [Luteimonas deserti]NYZ64187.1 GNAT family N-acetyltransferase [Luteimonas deserti]